VRCDDHLDARGTNGGKQFPDVLVQPDGLGDLLKPRVDLAVFGEEVVVRVDEDERGLGGS
jgi:hypothetical protein